MLIGVDKVQYGKKQTNKKLVNKTHVQNSMFYESKPKYSLIICILCLHIITSSNVRSIKNKSVELDLLNESFDLVHKTGVNDLFMNLTRFSE